MLKTPVFVVIIQVVFFSCSQVTPKETEPAPVAPVIQHLVCGQDSLQINYFLRLLVSDSFLLKKIRSFYQGRAYSPAWINASGINENAGNLINFLYNERVCGFQKPANSPDKLQELYKTVLSDTSGRMYCEDSLALQLEILLTKNFFEFAERNWEGADTKILKQVNWFIARKQVNYDQLLSDYLHSGQGHFPEEPVYRQYNLLKGHLRKYNAIALKGTWPALPNGDMKLKPGDTSAVVSNMRLLLFITGDMPENDSSMIFDARLESAVRIFQKRHGLKEDGIVSKKTLQAMRIPIQKRIRTILINMERCRWVPVEVSGDYLVVNIPEFRLHVYRKERHAWSCKVIVGKSDALHHTVIFNDSVECIVLNPYWNIPRNILKKEILPAIKRDAGYIRRNNLEVIDQNGRIIDASTINWNSYTGYFPYLIRQRPGEDNALGNLKFLFPNPYDIYMHDTPSKNLFNETERDFSHGCIRLEQPLGLAEFLLREDPVWTTERVTAAISDGKEIFVKLRKKTPIFIAYFTSWIDGTGKINFRNDIYGHDAKMEKLLFVN